MKTKFIIDKPISMCDESIQILIEGLPLDKYVTVKAESSDYYCINALPKIGINSIWSSCGTFKSSISGRLDLGTDASIAGNYTGVHPMGLIYMMQPTTIIEEEKSTSLCNIPIRKSYHIKLSVYNGNQKLCGITIERVYQRRNIISKDIYKKKLVARFFEDSEKINQPAIIILSGSDGRIEKAQNLAQLFASHGFASLAVCYFGLEGTSNSLSKIPLEIIEESITFLKKENRVNSQKIAIYGRSKGGELALLASSMFPEINCVVANTPSSFVMEGLNARNRNSKTSSWSYLEKELPYIPFKIKEFIPYFFKKILFKKSNLTSVYSKIISNKKVNNARIEIENIKGSVLLISSKNDEIWPSDFFCNQAIERLKRYDFKFDYQHNCYLYSGHHLTIAYQANPRYSQDHWLEQLSDSIHAWEETVNFFTIWSKD